MPLLPPKPGFIAVFCFHHTKLPLSSAANELAPLPRFSFVPLETPSTCCIVSSFVALKLMKHLLMCSDTITAHWAGINQEAVFKFRFYVVRVLMLACFRGKKHMKGFIHLPIWPPLLTPASIFYIFLASKSIMLARLCNFKKLFWLLLASFTSF